MLLVSFYTPWKHPTKWSDTLKQFVGFCLSVFDHFVGCFQGVKKETSGMKWVNIRSIIWWRSLTSNKQWLCTNTQKQPPEVFYKKGVLKNFAKFTAKHLCRSLFFNNPATLLKKETLAQVLSCEFCGMFKGGLSGWMTWQFLNVLELFSLQKSKLSNFRFRSIFIFNKKEPQSCKFGTYWQKALLEFLTSQTSQMAFTVLKVMIR